MNEAILSLSKRRWFYALVFGYLILNAIALYFEFFLLPLLPVVLFVVGVALFKMEWMLLFIVFATPLSIQLDQLEFGLGVALPTEPLLAGAMLVFVINAMYKQRIDIGVLRHPVTIAIFVHTMWVFITTLTSQEMVYSLKFFVSRLWFLIPGYFMMTLLLKKKENLSKFFWFYILGFSIVIIYTLIQHGMRNFEEKPAHWVMQPFFKDHTSYGAILAMYVPILVAFVNFKKWPITTRILSGFVLALFLVGTLFSYTRAAWVSLGGGLGVYLLIVLRIHIKYLLVLGGILIGGFFYFQSDIVIMLQRNKADSGHNLEDQVKSISNVATDASNLERLNRWNSAWRMFQERPMLGHGPGTYAFLYAPYQHSQELTIISTNFGDLGNAHSEYLGPLAEMGVLGLLTFLAIVFTVFYRAIATYYRLVSPELKSIQLATIVGLATYFIHGILNNYLDLDKANIPFWGFMAVLVAIEVYHTKNDAISNESLKS